jgi:hypothetical protein
LLGERCDERNGPVQGRGDGAWLGAVDFRPRARHHGFVTGDDGQAEAGVESGNAVDCHYLERDPGCQFRRAHVDRAYQAIANFMGMLKIKVSDISGSRVNAVEAPDDVPINRILVVLVERMNLPLNSPDGQLMSYKLHHRRTGSQLLDSQTLQQANVLNGDELRLQPEITAGVASAFFS